MRDAEQARAAARECFVKAASERDQNIARLLTSAGRTWLLVVSVAEGRTVRPEDVVTVEQLLAGLGALRQDSPIA